MSFLPWSDEFLTGIPLVDRQHRGLVDLVNEVAPHLAGVSRAPTEKALSLLDRLAEYAQVHFHTEEDLMRRQGMAPDYLIHHRRVHAGFGAQVAELRAQFEAGGQVGGDDLLAFLSDWLVFHILGEDQAMAAQLRSMAGGASAAAAHAASQAGDPQAQAPRQRTLVRALVRLFGLMSRHNRRLARGNIFLSESEAYNKLLFAESPVPLLVLARPSGRVEDCNRAALALFGLDRRAALLGRDPGELAAPGCAGSLAGHLAGAAPGATVSWRFLRADGEEWDAELRCAPFEHRGRELWQCSLADVTGPRRLEAELARHRENLEVLVATRTAELEVLVAELAAARDAADAASRAKSSFLANVSHELKTPMNAITGFAHLLETAQLPEKQAGQVRQIRDSARHFLALLEDILRFSRVDSGRTSPVQAEFSPAALCARVLETHSALALARGLALGLHLDPQLPRRLLGDVGCLVQVLDALIANAIKFTEQGSVRLAARVLDAHPGGARLRFEVHDTGRGLSEEQLQRLFRAFEPGDTKLSRRHGGLGLGLAMASRLAQVMGGRLGVDNDTQPGAVFHLTLDLASPPGLGLPADAAATRTPEASALELARARDCLWRLDGLLTQDDLHAIRVFEDASPLLGRVLGDAAADLGERIRSFDYQRALAILRAATRADPRLRGGSPGA